MPDRQLVRYTVLPYDHELNGYVIEEREEVGESILWLREIKSPTIISENENLAAFVVYDVLTNKRLDEAT